jgi:cellulose synthase/poly-beta-1,6-N-acetylglucosamine synthase-like glycosyltransferase
VQIALYNERYVAQRVIEAACALRWPALEIQILDDSTDDTLQQVEVLVKHYQKTGLNIHHLHRAERTGYKAGALAAGLQAASGDYIAIFDADFVPPPDFLERTMPYFAKPEVGFVQTRWGHLNADYSPLTRLQAVGIDAHFTVEQVARYQQAYMMNFNGTAGIWRKAAILGAGGWRSDSLTEDLDLSYRAQLAGWGAMYVPDILSPAELPVTLSAYRRQQFRWARGSMECARMLVPQILAQPISAWIKLQAILHLTGYGIQLLMSLVALLYPFMLLFMEQQTALNGLFQLTALFTLTSFAPSLYFLLGQAKSGQVRRAALPWILLLNIFGAGMIYHNAYAVLHGLFNPRPAAFERTPKFGIVGNDQAWQGKAYRLSWNPLLGFELFMLAYNLNTLRLAILTGHYAISFYAGLLALGGGMLLGLAWQEAFQQGAYGQHRRQAQAQIEG